jgi:predicted transcriptional regulator
VHHPKKPFRPEGSEETSLENASKMEARQLTIIHKGEKELQSGRVVSHGKMVRWLRSWGKKRELPPPLCK